jgi:hypothetical protein
MSSNSNFDLGFDVFRPFGHPLTPPTKPPPKKTALQMLIENENAKEVRWKLGKYGWRPYG